MPPTILTHHLSRRTFLKATAAVGTLSIPGTALAQFEDGVYAIRQKSSDRYVDAWQDDNRDYRLVTREFRDNDTQRWVFLPIGDGSSTIQQLSNGRLADAYQSGDEDNQLVTRERQDNDTQRWILDKV